MATKVLSLDYLHRVIQVFTVLYIVRSTNAIVQSEPSVPRFLGMESHGCYGVPETEQLASSNNNILQLNSPE
jgi:hypothetical protein